MPDETSIRPFAPGDAAAVRALFVLVNRGLAPPHLRAAFEAYIDRSIEEEIGRIEAYYGAHGGGFWVALRDERLAGMFGLEEAGPGAMELRRMYVHPDARRTGLGGAMLRFAEAACRRLGRDRMTLSTSELQPDALRLYEAAGYRRIADVIAADQSNKTVGGGIRRYQLEKGLGA